MNAIERLAERIRLGELRRENRRTHAPMTDEVKRFIAKIAALRGKEK